MRLQSWCGGALLLLALPASAWEAAFGVGVEGRWSDWREYRGGERLLAESGPQAAGLLRAEASASGWFARVETAIGGGFARYDGQLQTGQAYEADAWEETIDTDWRVGWREAQAEVSIGLLQRDWRRYIEGSRNVSSAEERYRWRYAIVGGAWRLPDAPAFRLGLDVGLPLDSYQKVYARTYEDFSLEPGEGRYWRITLAFRPDPARPFEVEPWFLQQSIKDSNRVALTRNGVPQGLVAYQPESERNEIGVTLRWRLGGSPAD
jgi:hypothetical protein